MTFFSRTLGPADAPALCALWTRFLPDPKNTSLWLPGVVGTLLDQRMVRGAGLFEDRPNGDCLAFGLSTFLSDTTAAAFRADPRPYLNLRLLQAARDGDLSGMLSIPQIAEANAGDGLEMFVMEYAQVTFDFTDPHAHELLNVIVPLYLSCHAGYNIKATMHETEVAVGHIQESGGNRRLIDVTPQHPHSLSDAGLGPRTVYGLTREDALKAAPTGVAKSIFTKVPPVFSFVPREQDILMLALDGLTDQAIAERLEISRDGVRNHWTAIYNHVTDTRPEVLSNGDTPASRRGAERRRLLLAHLKDKPQELRPRILKRRQRVA